MVRPPNILLITADQLRADALGCYGNQVCRTPNLDALAGGGVLFENAFTPNPICVPARAAITTGNYPHICTDSRGSNDARIHDDQIKLAEHFASGGYETYACGKLHYVPYAPPGEPRLLHGFQHCDLTESGRLIAEHDPSGKLRGLEDYVDYLADVGWAGYSRAHGVGNNDVRPCPSPLPPEHHVDHWVADRTIQRIREHRTHRAEQPFLIWCSFPKPHAPLDPPGEYANMYDPRDVPPPVGDESLLLDRNPYIDQGRYLRAQASLSPAARRVIKAYYYGLITHQDAQIGRVLEALRETNLIDSTIIIYTCDHGDLMGDFGTYFKCNFLEGSVRVPFIVRGPSVPSGQRREQLVGLHDILPTLGRMTGCKLPNEVQGLDISRVFTEPGAEVRDVIYSQCGDAPREAAMVCDGRWKYCYAQQGPTEELYDLQEDPHELVNLAVRANGESLCKPWRQRLIDEANRWGDTTLLDDNGLVTSPLDRSSFKDLPVIGMGWRWF